MLMGAHTPDRGADGCERNHALNCSRSSGAGVSWSNHARVIVPTTRATAGEKPSSALRPRGATPRTGASVARGAHGLSVFGSLGAPFAELLSFAFLFCFCLFANDLSDSEHSPHLVRWELVKDAHQLLRLDAV